MRISRIALPLLAFVVASAEAQTATVAEPPLPATGLDFTAIDEFWRVVDLLRNDVEPTDSQWRTLLATPGYRLAQMAIGQVVREDLELAFKPTRHAEFDSLTKLTNDRATRLAHLVRAASLRLQLDALRDSLSRSAPIAEAVKTAAEFLPPGATNVGDPPLVAFAIFRNDGYSLEPGVIVDLLNAYEANLVLFLGHEFHHTYVGRAQDDSTQRAPAGLRARTLLWSNSHANGAYIARTIYERFGLDSLFPAVTNPAALLRTYTAAEKARGNPPPFTPKAWRVIEGFERRYWR